MKVVRTLVPKAILGSRLIPDNLDPITSDLSKNRATLGVAVSMLVVHAAWLHAGPAPDPALCPGMFILHTLWKIRAEHRAVTASSRCARKSWLMSTSVIGRAQKRITETQHRVSACSFGRQPCTETKLRPETLRATVAIDQIQKTRARNLYGALLPFMGPTPI